MTLGGSMGRQSDLTLLQKIMQIRLFGVVAFNMEL